MKSLFKTLKAIAHSNTQKTSQIHTRILGTTGIMGLLAISQVALTPKVNAQTTPAYCSILYGIDNTGTNFSKIYNVNVTNATYNAATAVSGTAASNTLFFSAAAALEPSTGRLFYVSRDTTATKVAYWNPATNTHTQLTTTFNAGSTVVRAAFSPSGRLFVATTTMLFEINHTTGAQISSTVLHGVSAPSGGNGDMAFDGNNVLFLASDDSLYTIDINSFSASSPANLLAQAPAGTTFNSLGFKPDGKLYAFAGSNRTMYEINTNTGNLATIGTITFNPPTGATVVGTDYASCAAPTPNLQSAKTYNKVSGSTGSDILPGDVVEYTITVTNIGSVPATKASFKDPIPAGTTYVTGSTTMNGVAVTDSTGGTFPFANGRTIQSAGLKPGVIGTGSSYQVTIKYRIRVNTVNPPTSVNNQGTTFYLGNPTGGVPTDDPNTPTPGDPTVTTITPATTTISGTLYEDSDGGDDLDTGEPKLPANITVQLLDSNNLIKTTTTDANGAYTFTGVTNGSYKIQVDTNDTDIPSGYTLGTPNNLAVTVSGSPVTNQNFGFDKPQGSNITCPVGSTATGSGYATGGLGQYITKNAIYWLDWSCGPTTQFNPGDVVTKTWTAPNGISVTATVSNITKTLHPYNTGDWRGDKLDDLYNGVNPIGLRNLNASEDPSYKITFSMTLNGVPIPADIVTAEAEDTGESNEFATWTTDGDPWEAIEAAPNSSLKVTFSNAGKTIDMDDNPDGGGGVLVALTENVSNISVNMNAGGNEAIAFGIFIPFDYGDAPSSYGAAAHYARRDASGGSKPITSTNVNSLTMATLSYNMPYMGVIGADPEKANQPTANADGDKVNGENDEDAFNTLPNATATGTYALNNIQVRNTTGNAATLYAWVDFNKNGVFEASEFSSTPVANNGTSANLSWTIPSGTTSGTTYARFRLTTQALTDNSATTNVDERSIGTASNGEVEDYQVTVAGNPNVLLVKRITAVNNLTTTKNGDNLALYKDEETNPYDDNNITITNPNPPSKPADTNKWLDPSTFLIGGINGGKVNPNDEIEYTIYYLSTGDTAANNVLICDRVPENATFIPTAFNNFSTKNTSGLPGADRGIIWQHNGATESLTNISDGDTAEYLSPGIDPTIKYPGIKCDGSNINGAVVVKLGNIPNATAPGMPTSSYGFIRFRGRVK